MAKWRMKLMPLAEWAPFQEQFGELQIHYYRGDPDLAMFCKDQPGDELSEIYITGPELELVERLSPGGWSDAEAPSGDGVSLLVGTSESWEHLGVPPYNSDV